MSPPPPKKFRKSIAWDFYKKPNDECERINCPECSISLKYKGTTSGIISHLQSQHPKIYKALLERSEETADDDEDKEISNSEAEEILAMSFSSGSIPFRFAENVEFRRFLKLMPKNFKCPSGEKMRERTDQLAGQYIEKIKNQFKPIGKYSIITDGYSEMRRNYHFYSLHICYVDKNGSRNTVFVTIRGVEAGDNVAINNSISDALDEVGLKFSNCSAICADAGSPLVLLAQKQEVEKVHCGCHLLNLVIEDFAKYKDVQKMQFFLQNFASFLSRKKEERAKLISMAVGVSVPPPLSLSPTRWGALPILCERFLAYYPTLKDLSSMKKYLLKPTELSNIREMGEILLPIYKGILKLEKDSSYASEILPTLLFIQNKVSANQTKLGKRLAKVVDDKMKNCRKNERLLCSMLVDCRFAYDDKYEKICSWTLVESYISKYDSSDSSDTNNNGTNTSQVVDSDDIDSFFSSAASSSSTSNSSDLKTELIQYKALLVANRPTFPDPLHFWSGNYVHFEKLSKIAFELLSTPGSSAASERTFSRCTDIIRQIKRNRMKTETLNSVLVVNELSKMRTAKNIENFEKSDEKENVDCYSDSDGSGQEDSDDVGDNTLPLGLDLEHGDSDEEPAT